MPKYLDTSCGHYREIPESKFYLLANEAAPKLKGYTNICLCETKEQAEKIKANISKWVIGKQNYIRIVTRKPRQKKNVIYLLRSWKWLDYQPTEPKRKAAKK